MNRTATRRRDIANRRKSGRMPYAPTVAQIVGYSLFVRLKQMM